MYLFEISHLLGLKYLSCSCLLLMYLSCSFNICTELTIEHNEKKELGETTWSEVFDNSNNKMRSRTVYGMLLQTFQQLSGINAIMFYAPIIFDDFFGNKGGIYGSLALNVINFFSTFIQWLRLRSLAV